MSSLPSSRRSSDAKEDNSDLTPIGYTSEESDSSVPLPPSSKPSSTQSATLSLSSQPSTPLCEALVDELKLELKLNAFEKCPVCSQLVMKHQRSSTSYVSPHSVITSAQ